MNMPGNATDTELLRRAMAIANAALHQPESGRTSWVEFHCVTEPELLAEVLALLAADKAPAHAFERLADDEPADAWIGKQIGSYRICERIGSGGMGAVYRAEPVSGVTRQAVALKLIKRGMDSEDVQRRFLRERTILAGLDHPHIARLLDGGMHEDGRSWFAMELVEGRSLFEYCDDKFLPLDARLALFEQVCSAVDYAHRNLVIHRDLKPGNVLVTSDGTAKLLDFGIAKLLDDETEAVTRSKVAVLTPGYAAPEQYSHGAITTQTDVYLLGLMLAELLGGQRIPLGPARDIESYRIDSPFASKGGSDDARLVGAARRRGLSVSGLARALRGDLDRITRRALASDPGRRYASVAALADDLNRYRRGLPVLAMDDTLGYRLGKFVRRHRTGVAAGFVVLLAVVAGLGLSMREAHRLRVAQSQSDTALNLLESVFLGADPYGTRSNRTTAQDLLQGARERIATASELPPGFAARLWFGLGSAFVSLEDRTAAVDAMQRAIDAADQALACSGDRCIGADPQNLRILRASAQARIAYYAVVLDGDASQEAALDAAIRVLRNEGARGRIELAKALRYVVDKQFNRGEYDNLARLSAEILDLCEQASGPDSPDSIMALAHRASILKAIGDNAESLVAAGLARDRAGHASGVVGEGLALSVEQQYAGALGANGRAAEAEPILREARRRAEALPGADSQKAGLTWDLAMIEDQLGQPDRAIVEYRTLLARPHDEKSSNTAAVHNALGRALLGTGENRAAAAEFQVAHDFLCAIETQTPPCLAIRLNQAGADIASGDWAAAEGRLSELQEASIRMGGRLAMRWQMLRSKVHLHRREWVAASRAVQESRNALSDAGPVDPIDAADWLAQEAAIAVARNDPNARGLLEQAIAAYRENWIGRPQALLDVETALARLR